MPPDAATMLATVRRIVGRRHRITRDEMRTILLTLQTDGLIELDNGWAETAYVAAHQRWQAEQEARRVAREERMRQLLRADPLTDVPPEVCADPLADLPQIEGPAPDPTLDDFADAWLRACTESMWSHFWARASRPQHVTRAAIQDQCATTSQAACIHSCALP